MIIIFIARAFRGANMLKMLLNWKKTKFLGLFLFSISVLALEPGQPEEKVNRNFEKLGELRAPFHVEDVDAVVDQVISLEESKWALVQDLEQRFRQDEETLKSIKLAKNKTRNKVIPPNFETQAQALMKRYCVKDFESLDSIITFNRKNFTLDAIEKDRRRLEKIKLFLGRGKYPDLFDPLTIVKYLLFYRFGDEKRLYLSEEEFEDSSGCRGLPSTKPEDFEKLNDMQKFQVRTAVDQLAIYDQQLLLLYDLLPEQAIFDELRNLFKMPSLYLYIQGFTHGTTKALAKDEVSFHKLDMDQMDRASLLEHGVKPFTPRQCIEFDSIPQVSLITNASGFDDLPKAFNKSFEEIALQRKKDRERAKKKEKKAQKNLQVCIVPKESSLPEKETIDKALGCIGPKSAFDSSLDVNPKEAPPLRYQPEQEAGLQRKARIAKMIEEHKNDSDKSVKAKPAAKIAPIILSGDALSAYRTLFKLDHQAGPLRWEHFKILFKTALGGRIIKNRGNGASRTLKFSTTSLDGSIIESNRFIHQPHPLMGRTFGYESLNLLREHFRFWGLAPEQGNIVLQKL